MNQFYNQITCKYCGMFLEDEEHDEQACNKVYKEHLENMNIGRDFWKEEEKKCDNVF